MSKVISELLGFVLLHSVVGSKFSRHFFQPIRSETKTNPGSRVHIFPRVVSATCVITSSFDWFAGLSPSFLIGQSYYFGFGFTALCFELCC